MKNEFMLIRLRAFIIFEAIRIFLSETRKKYHANNMRKLF